MQAQITLYINNGLFTTSEVEYNKWKFPAGEIGVVLLSSIPEDTQIVQVCVEGFADSDDIMTIMMLEDALREEAPVGTHIDLYISYFPYSRQDRKVFGGESFSAKVLAKMLKSAFDGVYTDDPHSEVLEQWGIETHYKQEHTCPVPEGAVIVYPDAGAVRKNCVDTKTSVYGQKVRDENGLITGYELVNAHLLDENSIVYVVDDICDGGRTFIELAKVLPKVKEKHLRVTHGIFSKGEALLLAHYDTVEAFNTTVGLPT